MNKGKNTMKKKKIKEVKDIVKNNVLFDKEELGIWSEFALEGLMKEKSAIKKENTKDFYLKDNVKFMAGGEDEAISDEDYATCEALAQDGESIEDYAI